MRTNRNNKKRFYNDISILTNYFYGRNFSNFVSLFHLKPISCLQDKLIFFNTQIAPT